MKELIFLGTGTISPYSLRNPSSYFMNIGNKKILIDYGPGIYRKLISLGINPLEVDYIFITHFHTDHIVDLISFLFAKKYTILKTAHVTTILGHPALLDFIKNIESILRTSLDELKSVQLKTIQPGGKGSFENFSFQAVSMMHKPESLGYLFELDNITVGFTGDTDLNDNLSYLFTQSDILIMECSNHENNPVDGHLNPRKIEQFLTENEEKFSKHKKLYLTHLYPEVENSKILKKLIMKYNNIFLSYDDLKIKLEK